MTWRLSIKNSLLCTILSIVSRRKIAWVNHIVNSIDIELHLCSIVSVCYTELSFLSRLPCLRRHMKRNGSKWIKYTLIVVFFNEKNKRKKHKEICKPLSLTNFSKCFLRNLLSFMIIIIISLNYMLFYNEFEYIGHCHCDIPNIF